MLGESMMLQLVWKALKQQVLNEAGADAMQNKKPTLHGLIYTTAKQKKNEIIAVTFFKQEHVVMCATWN